jgi:hypothetical protein
MNWQLSKGAGIHVKGHNHWQQSLCRTVTVQVGNMQRRRCVKEQQQSKGAGLHAHSPRAEEWLQDNDSSGRHR